MGLLPDEIKAAMQVVIPSHVVTCAADGTPNASAISQVYYVDGDHVALSHQFFNKTKRNLAENPRAAVWLIHPGTFETMTLAAPLPPGCALATTYTCAVTGHAAAPEEAASLIDLLTSDADRDARRRLGFS